MAARHGINTKTANAPSRLNHQFRITIALEVFRIKTRPFKMTLYHISKISLHLGPRYSLLWIPQVMLELIAHGIIVLFKLKQGVTPAQLNIWSQTAKGMVGKVPGESPKTWKSAFQLQVLTLISLRPDICRSEYSIAYLCSACKGIWDGPCCRPRNP